MQFIIVFYYSFVSEIYYRLTTLHIWFIRTSCDPPSKYIPNTKKWPNFCNGICQVITDSFYGSKMLLKNYLRFLL